MIPPPTSSDKFTQACDTPDGLEWCSLSSRAMGRQDGWTTSPHDCSSDAPCHLLQFIPMCTSGTRTMEPGRTLPSIYLQYSLGWFRCRYLLPSVPFALVAWCALLYGLVHAISGCRFIRPRAQ